MSDNNEVDIVEQILNLWSSKISIISWAFSLGIIFTLLSYTTDPRFESKAVLNVVDEESSMTSPSLGLPSGFGGLAQSAGFNLNDNSIPLSVLVVETIRSKTFFKHLLEKADIKDQILGDDSKTFSYIEMHEYIFSKELGVFMDRETGLLHISYTHTSSVFARDMVNLIIDEINNIFRENKIEELKKAREYFEAEYENAVTNSIKTSLSFLLEKNLNETMLANVRDDYVLKIIDEPVIPVNKSSPVRSMFLIFGLIIGGLIGSLIAVIRFNFLQSRDI